MVIFHRRCHSPRDQPSLHRTVGRERRAQESFEVAAVGAFPQPLGLRSDRESARVEAHVQSVAKSKSLGELRELGIKPKPSPREGLDAAIVQVGAKTSFARRNCQRIDSSGGRGGVFCFGICPARDVGPAVADRLSEPRPYAWGRARPGFQWPAPGR